MTEERHLHCFTLPDAGAREGYPICVLVEKRVDAYIANALYESVNDAGFRRVFDAAGGSCTFYAYQPAEYHDVLAASLLSLPMAHRCMRAFPAVRRPHRTAKRTGVCPACGIAAEVEVRFIEVLRKCLRGDRDVAERHRRSDWLCIPHLEMFLEVHLLVPAWCVNFHVQKLKELAATMNRRIPSCNTSVPAAEKQSFTRNEIRALHRTRVRTLYGYRGIPPSRGSALRAGSTEE